jgi:hypothetical protein
MALITSKAGRVVGNCMVGIGFFTMITKAIYNVAYGIKGGNELKFATITMAIIILGFIIDYYSNHATNAINQEYDLVKKSLNEEVCETMFNLGTSLIEEASRNKQLDRC